MQEAEEHKHLIRIFLRSRCTVVNLRKIEKKFTFSDHFGLFFNIKLFFNIECSLPGEFIYR